jgi:hypothetical protein
MMGVGELAAAAGGYLVAKASGKLAENVGGEVGNRIVKLWDKVRAKLAGKEALADFEQAPEDADAQGALRLQLKKALEADPAFRDEVAALLGELKERGGERIVQSATTIGDANLTTQIAGSGNRVG